MSVLTQKLVTPEVAAAMIAQGQTLAIAGDEQVLATLPCGNWIGGTIPYFMGQDGGVTTRNQLFVTPIPSYPGLKPSIRQYDVKTLPGVALDGPDNGFSLIILPAFSQIHSDFAQNAATYEDMYLKPLVGWVSGIHLSETPNASAKVRDGREPAMLTDRAAVLHVPLPEHVSANVSIVNLFSPGQGDTIQFLQSGFEAAQCLVNGKPMSLARYLTDLGHDTRLPLVADYCGAMINVSLKSVEPALDRVTFYSSVFPGVDYRLAHSFDGSYEAALGQAVQDLPQRTDFSCNCVLNFLYGELDGKRTAHVTGPMTFGEVAYVLLNQTMVHMHLESHP